MTSTMQGLAFDDGAYDKVWGAVGIGSTCAELDPPEPRQPTTIVRAKATRHDPKRPIGQVVGSDLQGSYLAVENAYLASGTTLETRARETVEQVMEQWTHQCKSSPMVFAGAYLSDPAPAAGLLDQASTVIAVADLIQRANLSYLELASGAARVLTGGSMSSSTYAKAPALYGTEAASKALGVSSYFDVFKVVTTPVEMPSKATQIELEIERLNDAWDGPGSVAPSPATKRNLAAVLSALGPRIDAAIVEVDGSGGEISMRWYSVDEQDVLSVTMVASGKTIVTFTPRAGKGQSWALSANQLSTLPRILATLDLF